MSVGPETIDIEHQIKAAQNAYMNSSENVQPEQVENSGRIVSPWLKKTLGDDYRRIFRSGRWPTSQNENYQVWAGFEPAIQRLSDGQEKIIGTDAWTAIYWTTGEEGHLDRWATVIKQRRGLNNKPIETIQEVRRNGQSKKGVYQHAA